MAIAKSLDKTIFRTWITRAPRIFQYFYEKKSV